MVEMSRATLIVAGPGTGKTTELSKFYIKLVSDGISQDGIICITYTNRAVDHLRETIIRNADQSNVKIDRNRINVRTFHSYAYSILRKTADYALTSNNFLRKVILDEIMMKKVFNYEFSYIADEMVPKIENAIRYLKSYGIRVSDLYNPKIIDELRRIYRESGINNVSEDEIIKFYWYFIDIFKSYESEKEKTKTIDYNDMLSSFFSLYDGKKFQYMIIDELQDVSDLEARIALDSSDNIFAVGDRKQAIFGFQGGGFDNFERLTGSWDVEKRYLSVDRRSTRRIVEYAKIFFKSGISNFREYEKEIQDLKSEKEDGVPVRIYEGETSDVMQILKNVPEDAGSIGIITRTNDQLIKISEILDKNGVKYNSTAISSGNSRAKDEVLAFLRMYFYDDPDTIRAALYTPFSGYSLREAFELSESIETSNSSLGSFDLLKKFRQDISDMTSIKGLERVFSEKILPVSVMLGKDYFMAASAVLKNIREYFDYFKVFSREDFFSYLRVCEEAMDEVDRGSKITLTTVHKAKGLEFDAVIYFPKNGQKMSFVDAVSYSVISAVKGIDVRNEIRDESVRVDFVAMTRPRNYLYIVTDKPEKYENSMSESHARIIGTAIPDEYNRYFESYIAFVNHRLKDAEKIFEDDEWLYDTIARKIRSISAVSFTLMDSIENPFEFLKKNVLGMNPRTPALHRGTRIHRYAELHFTGQLEAASIPDEDRPLFDNVLNVERYMLEKYSAKPLFTEYEMRIPFRKALNIDIPLYLYGRADEVFTNGDSEIIVDLKTDRRENGMPRHYRQLYFYKFLYAMQNDIDQKRVKTAVAYVNLSGNIRTGNPQFKVVEISKNEMKFVEESINKIIEYRKNPDSFVADLLKCGEKKEISEDPLFIRVKNLLEKRIA